MVLFILNGLASPQEWLIMQLLKQDNLCRTMAY